MFDLKPVTRKEIGYARTKYQQLLDEFEEMDVEGVCYEPDGKAYSVASAINFHIKKSKKNHIECFSRGNKVYLFNKIKENRNEKD